VRLSLRIVSEQAAELGDNQFLTLDEQGGTIGRARGNAWVLPDPERYMSGRHAAIYFRDGAWYLADTSANGVFINDAGEPLGSEQPVQLHQGDIVHIADYDIEVDISGAAEADGVTPSFEEDLLSGAGAAAIGGANIDPLALLDGASPTGNTSASEVAGHVAGTPDATAGATADGLLDPFSAPPMQETGAFDGEPEHGATADHVAAPDAYFAPPETQQSSTEMIPDDWDIAEDELLRPPAPAATEEVSAPPPSASAPPPPPPAPAPAAAAPTPAADDAVPPSAAATGAINAFLQGAGLDDARLDPEQAAKQMRLIGEMFRAMIEGLREVLMARSGLKSGFRMDMTTIRPVENNPLKFSAGGVDEAMRQLLFSEDKGYLPALAAVEEGFRDIKDYQLGMMAGMQEAFKALLARFDPQRLATEFERNGRSGGLLASSRKAHRWDRYAEFYAEVLKQAEDDFQELFGDEFAQGYDAQVRKLTRARKGSGRN